MPVGWVSEPRELGLVAGGWGMNWRNEHSWRFLFPASEYETDQGEMETFTSPDSSWIASLNFSPQVFHPPTYLGPWYTDDPGYTWAKGTHIAKLTRCPVQGRPSSMILQMPSLQTGGKEDGHEAGTHPCSSCQLGPQN